MKYYTRSNSFIWMLWLRIKVSGLIWIHCTWIWNDCLTYLKVGLHWYQLKDTGIHFEHIVVTNYHHLLCCVSFSIRIPVKGQDLLYKPWFYIKVWNSESMYRKHSIHECDYQTKQKRKSNQLRILHCNDHFELEMHGNDFSTDKISSLTIQKC